MAGEPGLKIHRRPAPSLVREALIPIHPRGGNTSPASRPKPGRKSISKVPRKGGPLAGKAPYPHPKGMATAFAPTRGRPDRRTSPDDSQWRSAAADDANRRESSFTPAYSSGLLSSIGYSAAGAWCASRRELDFAPAKCRPASPEAGRREVNACAAGFAAAWNFGPMMTRPNTLIIAREDSRQSFPAAWAVSSDPAR